MFGKGKGRLFVEDLKILFQKANSFFKNTEMSEGNHQTRNQSNDLVYHIQKEELGWGWKGGGIMTR